MVLCNLVSSRFILATFICPMGQAIIEILADICDIALNMFIRNVWFINYLCGRLYVTQPATLVIFLTSDVYKSDLFRRSRAHPLQRLLPLLRTGVLLGILAMSESCPTYDTKLTYVNYVNQ